MKVVLARLARAVRVVVHDPDVHRVGKSLAAIVVVRALVAVGASAATVDLIVRALGF